MGAQQQSLAFPQRRRCWERLLTGASPFFGGLIGHQKENPPILGGSPAKDTPTWDHTQMHWRNKELAQLPDSICSGKCYAVVMGFGFLWFVLQTTRKRPHSLDSAPPILLKDIQRRPNNLLGRKPRWTRQLQELAGERALLSAWRFRAVLPQVYSRILVFREGGPKPGGLWDSLNCNRGGSKNEGSNYRVYPGCIDGSPWKLIQGSSVQSVPATGASQHAISRPRSLTQFWKHCFLL